jgi:hypothetical protein
MSGLKRVLKKMAFALKTQKHVPGAKQGAEKGL